MGILTAPKTASALETGLELLAVVVIVAWLALVAFVAMNADVGLTAAFVGVTLLTAVFVFVDYFGQE